MILYTEVPFNETSVTFEYKLKLIYEKSNVLHINRGIVKLSSLKAVPSLSLLFCRFIICDCLSVYRSIFFS